VHHQPHIEHHDDLGLAEQGGAEGDTDKLRILLNDLVNNALHYTGRGGRIDIFVREISHGVVLGVCDDGQRIPVAERADRWNDSIGAAIAPTPAAAWNCLLPSASPNSTEPRCA